MTTTESGLPFQRTAAKPRAIRPDRPTVWPSEDGYAIDVRWHGRECILRAVVVRRLLGPLEAVNGVLMGGLAAALLFAVMTRLGSAMRGRLQADEPS